MLSERIDCRKKKKFSFRTPNKIYLDEMKIRQF